MSTNGRIDCVASKAETIPFSERKGYADMTYGVYDGSKL